MVRILRHRQTTSVATSTASLYSFGYIPPIGDSDERVFSMAEVFVSDYIDKLALLERAVGHKVSYRVLEPFRLRGFESADRFLEIQSAAKLIGEFVGLGQLTFLIESALLGENTSGRIELGSSSREVFIQISADLFSFPEAILATLSHEISHKYLEVNRVSWAEGPANHYLTTKCSPILPPSSSVLGSS
jgi:hypothetical protein